MECSDIQLAPSGTKANLISGCRCSMSGESRRCTYNMVRRCLNYTFMTGLYNNVIWLELIGMSVTYKVTLRVVVTTDELFFPLQSVLNYTRNWALYEIREASELKSCLRAHTVWLTGSQPIIRDGRMNLRRSGTFKDSELGNGTIFHGLLTERQSSRLCEYLKSTP